PSCCRTIAILSPLTITRSASGILQTSPQTTWLRSYASIKGGLAWMISTSWRRTAGMEWPTAMVWPMVRLTTHQVHQLQPTHRPFMP
ncbi:hypothetical protein BC831DRAFT_487760, partial [Entophlyctis helioformis]